MDFNRAEQEYVRLKALYDQGDLTAEAFEAAGNDTLVVRDRFGRVWQIGVNSGKWYCFENGTWTQKEPDETLLPSTGSPLETPETLQAPPKPSPIFTLPSQPSDSEPSAEAQAAPVPREKLKNGARLSPAQIRKSFSWIGLVGVALLLVLGIFGLSTLLMREQSFGWNPGTPVRFGSPTPTRRATQTPVFPSATPLFTRTAVPTGTPSPVPSRTFTAEPQYAPQIWEQNQAIYFTSQSSLSTDWLTALQSSAVVSFEDYNQLGSMKILYEDDFLVFPSGTAAGEAEEDSAVQQEVVFAFPQPGSGTALTLMCRTPDGKNGYGLRVTPSRWKLFKSLDGVETGLAEGTAGLPLQQGDWSTMRLSCAGNQFNVWDETGIIATVEDSSLTAGRVAVHFEAPAQEPGGEVRLYFYRLLRLEK